MLEREDELREIKKEIIESRALVIKTNNLTNALSADIKSIARRQQDYEKRLAWNSATAYVVFVLVAFAALKLAWDARVDQVRGETEQRTQEAERLKKELRDAQTRDDDRARAEMKAAAFYDLVRQGKKAQVIEQHEAIKKESLTRTEVAVFADAVERARNELTAVEYQQGLDKARIQRWQEAATAYEEALRYKEDSAISPAVRLGLGQAYRHLGRQREAIPLLTALSEGSFDKELQDDALYELAFCQTEIQAWNDAKATWRALLRRFPDSRFGGEARMLLAQLNRDH